jgi:hypothetical protein
VPSNPLDTPRVMAYIIFFNTFTADFCGHIFTPVPDFGKKVHVILKSKDPGLS